MRGCTSREPSAASTMGVLDGVEVGPADVGVAVDGVVSVGVLPGVGGWVPVPVGVGHPDR